MINNDLEILIINEKEWQKWRNLQGKKGEGERTDEDNKQQNDDDQDGDDVDDKIMVMVKMGNGKKRMNE